MTAKEILYEIKDQHNIGTAWQLTEHIIIEAMEKYAQEQVKNCAIPLVNGWLDFESNKELFNEEAKKNCLCKFEDGTIIRYDDEHPMEIMTHFKLAEACR